MLQAAGNRKPSPWVWCRCALPWPAPGWVSGVTSVMSPGPLLLPICGSLAAFPSAVAAHGCGTAAAGRPRASQLCSQPQRHCPSQKALLLTQLPSPAIGHWLSPVTGWSLAWGGAAFLQYATPYPGWIPGAYVEEAPSFYQVSFLSFGSKQPVNLSGLLCRNVPIVQGGREPTHPHAEQSEVQSRGAWARRLVREGPATPQEVQEETPPGHHTRREGGAGCTGLAPVSARGPPWPQSLPPLDGSTLSCPNCPSGQCARGAFTPLASAWSGSDCVPHTVMPLPPALQTGCPGLTRSPAQRLLPPSPPASALCPHPGPRPIRESGLGTLALTAQLVLTVVIWVITPDQGQRAKETLV